MRKLPCAAMSLRHSICVTCGVQFAATAQPPESCPICLDYRQYVGHSGQRWTSLEEMRTGAWKNVVLELEPGITSIRTEPAFAIGQRALLVRTPAGNILWDCISFVDEATIEAVRNLGGISAIAISHPHFYSCMVEWSRAFGDVPIHLHAADRQWVQRPDANIQFWSGAAQPIAEGLTLIHTPGHFEGSQVLHWREGCEGRGMLFTGDQPFVCADPNWVSFMRCDPNFIPLSTPEVRGIVAALEPYPYERLYGAFPHQLVKADAKAIVRRSAERYVSRIS